MKSETIGNLAKALSAAQAMMNAAPMNKSGHFGKYADLGSIVESGRKPLTENGLSFSQLVSSKDDSICVETILMHESGEWVSSEFFYPYKGTIQQAGAVITYLRRYSLASILGMYADEDTVDKSADGNIEPPDNKSGSPEPASQMTLDHARTIVDSAGNLYCEMDAETLADKSIWIGKAIRKARQEENWDHLAELQEKQDAVAVLLQAN